jgi:type IV secretion system protein VirB9
MSEVVMKKYLTLLMVGLAFNSQAELLPEAYPTDNRVKQVAFQDNNVVTVAANTFTATQILFSRDESILAVEGGDTAGWMVTYHDNLPNMLFIKPTLLNSNTNMTVVTNKHQYYFHVKSNASLAVPSTEQLYALKFNYPEEERRKLEAIQKAEHLKAKENQHKNAKVFNWNYRFSGNTQVRPQHIYDDGTFTYFELAKNQPVPAIFAVDERQGKESMVNTRRQGNVLVVQRLAPQFTLRHGGLVASVFNSNEIARIGRN